jgi:EAL domain
MRGPTPPSATIAAAEDLARLGEALLARSQDVVERTVKLTVTSGEVVDALVQDSFERIGTSSTAAVARWIAGEDLAVVPLVRTLVQLGKALSIETFAEGIEQQHELSLLRQEDCDSGQGFLFARPLDVAATEVFLRNWADSLAPALVQTPPRR